MPEYSDGDDGDDGIHEIGTQIDDEGVRRDAIARRPLQRRRSKHRAMEQATDALKVENFAAMTWKPRRCIPVIPVLE